MMLLPGSPVQHAERPEWGTGTVEALHGPFVVVAWQDGRKYVEHTVYLHDAHEPPPALPLHLSPC